MSMDSPDGPDVLRAKRLLDKLKVCGFQFQRTAPGPDGPLMGQRASGAWADTVYIEGFSRDCFAWRQRRSSLIVPGEGLVERQISGDALTVLSEALTWHAES